MLELWSQPLAKVDVNYGVYYSLLMIIASVNAIFKIFPGVGIVSDSNDHVS